MPNPDGTYTPEEAQIAADHLLASRTAARAGAAPAIEHVHLQAAQPPEHIMQFFAYAHLPPAMQDVSKPFCELAERVMTLPRNPERTVALRKLLEAKDAAVRAFIAK